MKAKNALLLWVSSDRAIEGYSMGGRGATRLAMKFPELFCSLHNQAGNVIHLLDLYDPKQPDTYPNNYLGPDRARYEEKDVYTLIRKNAAAIKAGTRILITCGTRDDGHLPRCATTTPPSWLPASTTATTRSRTSPTSTTSS